MERDRVRTVPEKQRVENEREMAKDRKPCGGRPNSLFVPSKHAPLHWECG